MELKNQIFIDLEKCYQCKECTALCNYPLHPQKNGIKILIEEAIRKITCRHCEDAPCLLSCPNEALKKEGDDIKRASFLCTSCKTCLLACPFGVNTLETVEFKISFCDLCQEREAECVKTCPQNAIKVGKFEENVNEDIYKIREGLFVKAVSWWKQLGTQPKLRIK
ncbi:MAG: hypothetical protein COX48_03415 [bacterium (Candidatus Stahlbacteria) CG23_combo_of_CG06-09_8_20_14_all_34_7]|nr:MAG: hypothetical protein COX48_03415 [bacterium (Candidatus Stahlbacteria) CG23_combo_of_CG06-09_8_20_14_all_34_7]